MFPHKKNSHLIAINQFLNLKLSPLSKSVAWAVHLGSSIIKVGGAQRIYSSRFRTCPPFTHPITRVHRIGIFRNAPHEPWMIQFKLYYALYPWSHHRHNFMCACGAAFSLCGAVYVGLPHICHCRLVHICGDAPRQSLPTVIRRIYRQSARAAWFHQDFIARGLFFFVRFAADKRWSEEKQQIPIHTHTHTCTRDIVEMCRRDDAYLIKTFRVCMLYRESEGLGITRGNEFCIVALWMLYKMRARILLFT